MRVNSAALIFKTSFLLFALALLYLVSSHLEYAYMEDDMRKKPAKYSLHNAKFDYGEMVETPDGEYYEVAEIDYILLKEKEDLSRESFQNTGQCACYNCKRDSPEQCLRPANKVCGKCQYFVYEAFGGHCANKHTVEPLGQSKLAIAFPKKFGCINFAYL